MKIQGCKKVVCFVALAIAMFSGNQLIASESTGMQRNFILETHPVSWGLFGANFDVEVNTGSQNSYVLQYQHYGNESPLNSDLEDDPKQPETFSGNNFILGMRWYRDFAEKGLDSFYYGIAIDYISVKYTNTTYYFDTDWIKVSTELEGIGPRIELGWRWLWPTNKITVRFGFYAGYIFLKKEQKGYPVSSSNPDDDIEGDKQLDEGIAQLLAGMIAGIRAGVEFSIGFAF